MNIQELFDPEKLPEDLQWVVAQWKLHPNDPVFALIAWHWHRIQQSEDRLRDATMELRSAVDRRIDSVVTAAETVVSLHEKLDEVQSALRSDPLEIGKRMERDLGRVIGDSVGTVGELELKIRSLTQSAETLLVRTQRRQALACFLIGVSVGLLITGWFD
jgi:tetrahydromethanopterin S-methyltransferase subunit G